MAPWPAAGCYEGEWQELDGDRAGCPRETESLNPRLSFSFAVVQYLYWFLTDLILNTRRS